MGIIRSMWFRNEEEVRATKELLAGLRGNAVMRAPRKPVTQPKPSAGHTEVAFQTRRDSALPQWVREVMMGGYYPNREDLTAEEAQILYDPAINGLVNQYRATQAPQTELMIEDRYREIIG